MATTDDRLSTLEQAVSRIDEAMRWLNKLLMAGLALGAGAAGGLYWQNHSIEKALASIEAELKQPRQNQELKDSIQELIAELRSAREDPAAILPPIDSEPK